jgi:cytochrome c-type biogenesis protein CcmF
VFLFGLILSFGQSKVISKNILPVDLGKSFDEKTNMLLTKNSILPIGDYYVNYKGHVLEGNTEHYQLDFLRKENDQYYKDFTITPSVILNNTAGNVYSPDTKHFLSKDIFTYILYAQQMDESADASYHKVSVDTVKVGDTIAVDNVLFLLDSLKTGPVKGKKDKDNARVEARIKAVTKDKDVYYTTAAMVDEDGYVKRNDGELKEMSYTVSIEKVPAEKDHVVIGIYQSQQDMVVIKSIEFPYILVMWSGSLIMLAGFIISFVKRWKKRGEEIFQKTDDDE